MNRPVTLTEPSRGETGTGQTRGLDLRLAAGAAAAWLAVIVATGHGSGPVLTAGGVLLASGLAVGLVAVRGRGRRVAALGLCALCAGAALLPLAAAVHRAHAAPVSQWAARRTILAMRIRIAGSPRPAGTGPGGTTRVALDAVLVAAVATGNGHGGPPGPQNWRVRAPVVVFADAGTWATVRPGEQVTTRAVLVAPQPGELIAGLLVPRGPPTVVSAGPWWQRAAAGVRAGLRRACQGLPEPVRGLLPGLVDGDTSGLDPILAEQFRVAGLTHLVAVSGTNLAVLLGLLVPAVRRVSPRPVIVAAVGLLAVGGFLVVAGPQPSVLRAAVMGTIGVLALAHGRPREGLPALAAAVLVLLWWHPEWARDAGFAMSVLASAALLLLAPGWSAALHRRGVPGLLADGLAVAAAATVVTAPVIVVLGGRVSLVSVPANLLAEPAVPAATALGVLAAAVAWWWPAAGVVCAWLAAWPARWLAHVAQWSAGVPGASVDWPATLRGALLLVVVLLAVVVLARRRAWRVWLAAAAVTALVVQVPVRAVVSGWPVPGWALTACDIGQGDGLVLPAGAGRGVVVDTGPGPVPMDRCLRSLSVSSLPLVVLTHFDLDHVGGIAGVVHGRPVGDVVTGSTALSSPGHTLVDRVLAGVGRRVRAASPGEIFHEGGLTLTSLWPPAGYVARADDSNDTSLVLRAEIGGIRVLLTGDLGPDGQRELLSRHVDLRADVLKVMHHGSRFFDPDFVAAVHPRVAVISVGLDNDYGHPAPSLLADLARLSVPVLRTDRDGAIEIAAGPGGLRTATRATPRSQKVVGLAPGAPTPRPASAGRATMSSWRPPASTTLQPPTAVQPPTGVMPRRTAWWSSSATRSIWSPAPSSRSPPRRGAPTRTPRSSNARAPTWPPRSWPSC